MGLIVPGRRMQGDQVEVATITGRGIVSADGRTFKSPAQAFHHICKMMFPKGVPPQHYKALAQMANTLFRNAHQAGYYEVG